MIMKIVLTTFIAALLLGCGGKAEQTNTPAPQRAEKLQTVAAHTTENQPAAINKAATGEKGKWSQSGDPIDTEALDAAIAKAEKNAKAGDDEAKRSLSDAYYRRGVALTEARQYASALGDYRRAVKHDPSNEDAKKWIDQIVNIYDSIGREAPPEGQEPPPLPFNKS